MKKAIWAATFLVLGSGSVGVAALDNVRMQGSDTLKDFTLSVITAAVCPGSVGIQYFGGGSPSGESNMVASLSGSTSQPQTTAPMSRFLQGSGSSGVCAVDAHRAEAIAFGAQLLAVSLSRTHLACDPHATVGASPNSGCTPDPTSPKTGLRNSGALTTGYVLGDGTSVIPGWRDVLRLVYLGLPKSAGKNPAPPTNSANNNRNCNSPERKELVNSWGNLFEIANCSSGSCTQLNHAWRRDLVSGTSDVFLDLINARSYPYCNTRSAFDAQPTLPINPPTKLAVYPNPGVRSDGSSIFEDPYQDFDPIRRVCQGGGLGEGASLPEPDNSTTPPTQPDFPVAVAEQVCSAQGSLGLVLPIRPPLFSGQNVDQLYPNKPCLAGNLIFGAAPKIPNTANSTLCPNGDVTFGNSASDYDPATGIIANSSNTCLIPATSAGDARCINGANNFNAPIDAPPSGNIPGNRRDGRVFNLHQYNQFGGYRSDTLLGAGRNVVGNFSRIHTTRTLVAAAPGCPGMSGDQRCCAQDDATAQIGCLVEADQCSFGYSSGVESTSQVLTTSAGTELAFGASIDNVKFDTACVGSQYPLWTKAYLSSIQGFENTTGQELFLARCFAGAVAGGATQFASLLAAASLVPLPTGPVCEDFPNQGCSSNNTPSNACVGNATFGLPE